MEISEILKELKSQDKNRRCSAACAAGELGAATAEEAVPALVEALEDEELEVQKAALFALANLGPIAKEALKDVCKVLKSNNTKLRWIAERAVDKIRGIEINHPKDDY